MITNNATYTYETTYNRPGVITQCWTNGTFTVQCGPIHIRYNIHWIKPYKNDKNVEDINIEKYLWRCQHMITSYILMY